MTPCFVSIWNKATPAGQEALHRLLELGFDFDTPRVPIVVTVQVEQHQLSDILSTLLREFSQLSGVSDVILLGSHEILILNALSEAQKLCCGALSLY